LIPVNLGFSQSGTCWGQARLRKPGINNDARVKLSEINNEVVLFINYFLPQIPQIPQIIS
jgi:hypothetical protein